MSKKPKKQSSELAVLEETGTAFDPTAQHLDLSKEEKRRTTALMMAIQAYRELIIKDADMLREASEQSRRNDGPSIKPATIEGMVTAAITFDAFIAGSLHAAASETTKADAAVSATE